MIRETCVNCGRPSYSAAVESTWICPYCGADITNANTGYAMPAECFWCEERMMKTANDMYVCLSCGWRWGGECSINGGEKIC